MGMSYENQAVEFMAQGLISFLHIDPIVADLDFKPFFADLLPRPGT